MLMLRHSGIMRLTVTVVVIMFELTGALPYILPTMVSFIRLIVQLARSHCTSQIVLLVTKAVGDFLGTVGIADEMIRFNGFPFLEKDDEAYNVSGARSHSRDRIMCSPQTVSRVMKTQLHTMPASGLCIRDVGKYLMHV